MKGQAVDIMLHAWTGRFTNWLSPASFGIAMYDWLAHLGISPAKHFDLTTRAIKKSYQLAISCHQYIHETNCSGVYR